MFKNFIKIFPKSKILPKSEHLFFKILIHNMAPKTIKSANTNKKLKIKLGFRSKSLKTLVRDKRLRLTNRKNYTNAEFESALSEIKSGRLSQRQVSQKFDIPLTTLNNSLNGVHLELLLGAQF